MKEDYSIVTITKKEAACILLKYHYLKDESKGFKSGHNYGLMRGTELVGAIVFTGFPVPELAKGCFGLERTQQEGLFELSRLCLHPKVQGTEHNLTSWFVAKAMRQLRKDTKVKALLSYADSNHHEGTIYRACNFKYYGLSAAKKDFWIEQGDGSYVKHTRGPMKLLKGEWRDRSRKHRFLLVYDKQLKCRWEVCNNEQT